MNCTEDLGGGGTVSRKSGSSCTGVEGILGGNLGGLEALRGVGLGGAAGALLGTSSEGLGGWRSGMTPSSSTGILLNGAWKNTILLNLKYICKYK